MQKISIHSLRMEGDTPRTYFRKRPLHFNPLPPHGGRLNVFLENFRDNVISIHSLRMEGDNQSLFNYILTLHFNPLPPHGGRRKRRWRELLVVIFQSTPSAWRETLLLLTLSTIHNDFNPLPPHGGRLIIARNEDFVNIFQSTPSAWRETHMRRKITVTEHISIHSLRMEGD